MVADFLDKFRKCLFGMKNTGISDDHYFSAGNEGEGHQGFAKTVDILVLTIHVKKIQFPVTGWQDAGNDFIKGILDQVFFVAIEKIAGGYLSLPEFTENFIQGFPCITGWLVHGAGRWDLFGCFIY
jgi:hypothetical protein